MNAEMHRPSSQKRAEENERFYMDEVTDEDIEIFLSQEESSKNAGFWNLPTLAGLSIILVGIAYLLQEMGLWNGFNLSTLAETLPWLAGILIILLGFGVLSWKPKRKKKRVARSATTEIPTGSSATVEVKGKKRLTKSRDKKISGVCSGIAQYLGIDPTIVRIAFVLGAIFGSGTSILLYIILAFVVPDPDQAARKDEQRITIIRDR